MRNFRLTLVIFSLLWLLGCESKKDELIEAPGSGSTTDTDGGGQGEVNVPTDPVSNNPPIAFDANLMAKQNEVLLLPSVAIDADGDSLTYKIEVEPQNGEVISTSSGFTYEPAVDFVGVDEFKYSVSDSKQDSEIAKVKIFVIKNKVASSFWLRSEDIQASGGDGDVISDWKESISGVSAAFIDADKTPRFVQSLSNSMPGAHFEFVDGDLANNDFMFYPNAEITSKTDGLSFIAVGETAAFSDAVAPVFSLGEWAGKALGFTWNATHAGVLTPLQAGGEDSSELLTIAGNGLSIVVSQIRFSSPASNNGFQRVRINGGPWMNSDTTLGVNKLTSAELSLASQPSDTATPIMIGATSSFATNANQRFSGKLGEIIVMDRFLSNQELQVIEAYLKAKFNIP